MKLWSTAVLSKGEDPKVNKILGIKAFLGPEIIVRSLAHGGSLVPRVKDKVL